MITTIRIFKYSTQSPPNTDCSYTILHKNSKSKLKEEYWHHYYTSHNKILYLFIENSILEIKLEIEKFNRSELLLLDFFDLTDFISLNTHMKENILFFILELKDKKNIFFQITFYSETETFLFNEKINAIFSKLCNKKMQKNMMKKFIEQFKKAADISEENISVEKCERPLAEIKKEFFFEVHKY